MFCSGLLYHLPEPWKLIERLAPIAPKLFLWTMYADDPSDDIVANGFRGRNRTEGGADKPLSGLSSHSLWLTLGSLLDALTKSGYQRIEIINNQSDQSGNVAAQPAWLVIVALAAFPRLWPKGSSVPLIGNVCLLSGPASSRARRP